MRKSALKDVPECGWVRRCSTWRTTPPSAPRSAIGSRYSIISRGVNLVFTVHSRCSLDDGMYTNLENGQRYVPAGMCIIFSNVVLAIAFVVVVTNFVHPVS